MTDYTVEAARGSEFLDVQAPGCLADINLDILDMRHNFRCILGQRYGDFEEGMSILGIDLDQATYLGFHAREIDLDQEAWGTYAKEYAKLTEAWKTLILQRRLEMN